MKKLKFWGLILVSIMCAGLSSCGGDDEGGGAPSIVDGINVNNGKKLVGLDVQEQIYDINNRSNLYKLRASYDSKGRLSKIVWINGQKYENGKYIYGEVELVNIDYDLRLINFNSSYYNRKFMFSVNNQGYFSQIGDCSLNYDSFGYLVGTENHAEKWSLSYNEGEFIKSMVNVFDRGRIHIYYMFYGEDRDKGELLFTLNSEKYQYAYYGSKSSISIQKAACFFAYHAGLFGKVTNRCTQLSKSNMTNAILERSGNNIYKMITRCSFTFE